MYDKIIEQYDNLADQGRYKEGADLIAKTIGLKLNILDVNFKSMQWDKDGQKRNVFKCELIKGSENYIFEFGGSVAESCDYVTEISTLKPTDKIEIYAGLKFPNTKVSAGINFSLTLEEAQNLSIDFTEEKAEEFKRNVNLASNSNNKKIYTKFDAGVISKNVRDNKLIQPIKDNSVFIQYIQKAVKRKLNTLAENKVISKDKQLSSIKNPTMYDVLACLTKYDPESFEDFCANYGYDEDSRTAERTYKSVVKEWENMNRLFTTEELELLTIVS